MTTEQAFANIIKFKDNRKEDVDYLEYLAKHKYYVYKGGQELGANKITLLKHDWSKFKPELWVPYREYFKGTKYTDPKDPNYNSSPTDRMYLKKKFKDAAYKHTLYEKHHDYKYHNPKGTIKPDLENLADWWSLNKSLDHTTPNIKTWLRKKFST